MGWDVWLSVESREQEDPVRHFVRIVSGLAAAGWHREVIRLRVRSERYEVAIDGIPIDKYILEEKKGPITLAEIEQLPERYGGEALAVEGWLQVPRDLSRTDEASPALSDYRVIVTTVGKAFVWPALKDERADIVYDAGDSRYFSPSVHGEAARRNIDFLLREAALLVSLGAERIRGLDADRSSDPTQAWLCYHRSAEGFRSDLRHLTGSHDAVSGFGPGELRHAAWRSGCIIFSETTDGLGVCHKDAVDGTLAGFYQQLLATTSSSHT